MDNLPRPDTMQEWVSRQNQNTAEAPRGGAMGPTTVVGTVTFPAVGAGKIGVLLDDGQTNLRIISVPADYSPQYGDQVACTRSKLGWHIVQKLSPTNMFAPQQPLTLLAGWTNYDTNWHGAAVGRSGEGIVQLQGLIKGGTLTAGTVITNLPVGMRPDLTLVFGIENADTSKCVEVRPNGDVVLRSSILTNYISFIDIKFPAAGVANWTNVTAFLNGWVPYYFGGTAATYAPPRWWIDPVGMMWVQGAVSSGAATVDNTPIFAIPSAVLPKRQNHLVTASADAFGFIGADPVTASINWKNGTTSNAWVGLTGAVIETILNTTMPFIPVSFQSTWGNYSAAPFTQTSFAKSPGGLVYHQGLMTSSSPIGGGAGVAYGQPVGYVPKAQQPGYTTAASFLSNRASLAARGRLDARADGAMTPSQGSNNWFSMDALTYLAEQ